MVDRLIGSISGVQPGKEQIQSYLEQVELYFTANNFPEGRRVPALLGVIGTYKVLRNLLAPDLPKSKDSKTLTDTLKQHYSPTANLNSLKI